MPSFPAAWAGGAVGGTNLDFGSGGWITAENAHEHNFDEEDSEEQEDEESDEDSAEAGSQTD